MRTNPSAQTQLVASAVLTALADCDHGALQLERLEDIAPLVGQPWSEIRTYVQELIASHVLSWDETTGRLQEGVKR